MLPQARKDELFVEKIDNEILIYDRKRERIHRLNPATALVWQHSDGKKTIPDLALLLHNKLGMPLEEEIVHHALERLDKAGLLNDRGERPAETPDITRRQLVRRFGLAGSMAILLPVIATLVAPQKALAVPGCTCSANPGLPTSVCDRTRLTRTESTIGSGTCGGSHPNCRRVPCRKVRRFICEGDGNGGYAWMETSVTDDCRV